MAISSVMLSHRPTVDRISCFDFIQQAAGRDLDVMFGNQVDDLSDREVKAFADRGIVLIGVGKGRTYREREVDGEKFWSETELILNSLLKNVLPKSQILARFAEMMSRNNRDGYLLRQPYSVNQIVRDAYRLGHDPEETEYIFLDEEVVHRGAHVVRTYLNARKREEDGLDLGAREWAKQIAADLLPPRVLNQYGPMTVLRYIRDMCTLYLSENDLREHAEWFVRIQDHADGRRDKAEYQAATEDFETFEMLRHNERGTWVESDDPWLLEALATDKDLVVMQSRTGNVIITSRTFDITYVGFTLQSMEPKLWHAEVNLKGKGRNTVANGTEGIRMQKTELSRKIIEYIIGDHVVRKRQ